MTSPPPSIGPRRIKEDGSEPFEQQLIHAGRADSIPPESRARILGALGLVPLPSANLGLDAGPAADAAGKSGMGLGTGAAWKAAGLGGKGVLIGFGATAAGGLAILGLVHSTQPAALPPAAVKPQIVTVVTQEIQPAPRSTETTPVEPVEPKPVARVIKNEQAAPKKKPLASTDSLSRELAILDSARAALGDKDAPRALTLLNRYRRQFPMGRLRSESSVLRIEALEASGDHSAAKKLGKRFLQRSPNGPYARRIRSLLGEGIPGDRE